MAFEWFKVKQCWSQSVVGTIMYYIESHMFAQSICTALKNASQALVFPAQKAWMKHEMQWLQALTLGLWLFLEILYLMKLTIHFSISKASYIAAAWTSVLTVCRWRVGWRADSWSCNRCAGRLRRNSRTHRRWCTCSKPPKDRAASGDLWRTSSRSMRHFLTQKSCLVVRLVWSLCMWKVDRCLDSLWLTVCAVCWCHWYSIALLGVCWGLETCSGNTRVWCHTLAASCIKAAADNNLTQWTPHVMDPHFVFKDWAAHSRLCYRQKVAGRTSPWDWLCVCVHTAQL